MASSTTTSNGSSSSIQLYPEKTNTVSDFWREKYEREASKYWDKFYLRNTSKFFKDRHYLQQEWGAYLSASSVGSDTKTTKEGDECSIDSATSMKKVALEVGCGVGNAVYPLVADNPGLFVYACDFSPRAIALVKAHQSYDPVRVKAFVCDVTADDLTLNIPPSSVDVVTLIFVLSAISPHKMAAVVTNISRVLKPGGVALVRDYAAGDLAEKRFAVKESKISENFYVRGDGTRAYYFTEEGLQSLFVEGGFRCEAMKLHARSLENRARDIVMDRRWIQAEFSLCTPVPESANVVAPSSQGAVFHSVWTEPAPGCRADDLHGSPAEDDLVSGEAGESSGGTGSVCAGKHVAEAGAGAAETGGDVQDKKEVEEEEAEVGKDSGEPSPLLPKLFVEPPEFVEQEIRVGSYTVRAVSLHPQERHVTPQTGLLLWECATALASLLAAHPSLVAGKTVLELGAGGVGLCALAASLSADRVVATDGDPDAVRMLAASVARNAPAFPRGAAERVAPVRLRWGDAADIANALRWAREGPKGQCQSPGRGEGQGGWQERRRSEGEDSMGGGGEGFDVVLGTDVAYVAAAVPRLFETAAALMGGGEDSGRSLLVLCHVTRRVHERDILAEARHAGLVYVGAAVLGEPVLATAERLGLSFDSDEEDIETARMSRLLRKEEERATAPVDVGRASAEGVGGHGEDGIASGGEGLCRGKLLRLLCFRKAVRSPESVGFGI